MVNIWEICKRTKNCKTHCCVLVCIMCSKNIRLSHHGEVLATSNSQIEEIPRIKNLNNRKILPRNILL